LATCEFEIHDFRHLEQTLLRSEVLFSLPTKKRCPQLLDALA
jgi:hypothetical protein